MRFKKQVSWCLLVGLAVLGLELGHQAVQKVSNAPAIRMADGPQPPPPLKFA